jgi:hypothetical protein
MYKKILFLILITLFSHLSCYDGLLDTYDNSIVYKLRDRGPAGGWIFYINPNYKTDGWRYLEAAPSDQSNPERWYESDTGNIAGTVKDVGKGQANTTMIVNFYGRLYPYAARSCDELTIGGYGDWFLPSSDELKLMRANLHSYGILYGFQDDGYWSSEQYTTANAYYLNFNDPNGNRLFSSKMSFARVRAIRAF